MAAPAYRTSTAGGGTSGTTNRTADITPAVGDLIIAVCNASGNTNASVTCSDTGSGTYTKVGTALKNTSTDILSVFVRDTLMANTTTVTVTVATGSNTAAEIVLVAISNMAKQSIAAIRSNGFQANQVTGGTPAPALNQAALSANVTIAGVANSTTGGVVCVPNASWTERQDVGQTTPVTGLEVCTRDSGFTGTTITFGGTSSTPFASFAIEVDVDNSATLSKTLAGLTTTLAGTVAIQASTTQTLAGLTTTLAGTVDVQGTASKTLGTATLSADGTVSTAGISGTASVTLADASSSATGTIAISGAASPTLGAVTDASAGTVAISGTASDTLGTLSSSSTGTVAIAGTASNTLGALSDATTGTVLASGALASTLAIVTPSATGAVAIAGASTKTLATIAISADGIVGTPPTLGDASITLSALSASAAGQAAIQGSLTRTLGTLAGTESGSVDVTGICAVTLGAIALSAAGTVAAAANAPVLGAASVRLGYLSCQATDYIHENPPNGEWKRRWARSYQHPLRR